MRMTRYLSEIALLPLSASLFAALVSVRGATAADDTLLLGDMRANRTTVVITSDCGPGTLAAAAYLQDYLSKITGHKVPLWTDSEILPEQIKEPVLIVAGRLPCHRWTAPILGLASPIQRNEGFSIQTAARTGRSFVIIRASDDSGIRYGLYRLVEELAVDDDSAVRLGPMKTSEAPLVAGRILGLFWNGGIPPEEAARRNPESWPIERLHLYMDLMDSMGFNGLQTWDHLAGNYQGSRFSFTRTQWRSKLIDILARNRLRGWRNLLFVWANTLWDHSTHSDVIVRDLEKAENLWAIGDYYDYQASLAPYLDYFLSHNVDPGGGKNFAHVQMLHLMLRGRFAGQNPAVRPAFSYWYMFDGSEWWGWKGPMEQGALRLLDMAMMPRDSIQVIGLHGGRPETWHQVEVLREFKSRGFDTGIWAWYWADFEYQPGLHVHASRLQRYFDMLPRDVARELVFHTVESSNHEMNLPSLYAAAQMLWNPDQKAADLIRKYCRGLFGPAAGPVVSDALLDIDRIRCAHPFSPGFCGAGTEDPASDLKISLKWIDRLGSLKPDPGWIPKFRILKPVEAQIEDIRTAFQQIADFARFRISAEEVRVAAMQPKLAKSDLTRMVKKLPLISKYTIEHQRWLRLMSELNELVAAR